MMTFLLCCTVFTPFNDNILVAVKSTSHCLALLKTKEERSYFVAVAVACVVVVVVVVS